MPTTPAPEDNLTPVSCGGKMPHRHGSALPARPACRPATAISARDDVAIALRDLAAGEAVTLDGVAIELLAAIPRGHKFALRSIARRRAGPQVRSGDRPGDGAESRAARTSTRTTSQRCSRAWTNIDSRRARPARLSLTRRAAVVHGLSTRGRPRRHAQRDLDPLHRRLRRPHRRAHRATGRRALQGPRRRRIRVPPSVRLLAARRRSRAHAQADRGACAAIRTRAAC